MDEARLAVEAAARASYARLISFLSARSGDVAAAEDALADAFVAALRTWPAGGIPSSLYGRQQQGDTASNNGDDDE